MAITEVIFPPLKTDQATIDEVNRNWPMVAKKLTDPNPGLLAAFRGWVLYENEQDVRQDHREIVILEWCDESSFQAFFGSDQFAAFGNMIKHLLTGPPKMELYETSASPKEAAASRVVEIIRLTVQGAESIGVVAQAWDKISELYGKRINMTYGTSLNLETSLFVAILGWASSEERSAISKETAFLDGFNSLKSLAEASQLIVDVAAVDLPSV
ncbi:hypothetical protein V1505DRAFT_380646 [Lipomyces doorenjongii]